MNLFYDLLIGSGSLDAQGMILPACYVDVQAVERIFGHPSRLMHLLARKIESDIYNRQNEM